LVILVTFVFPYLTWAFEPSTYPSSGQILFNNKPVNIPEQLGTVMDQHQGGERLVVDIQDLHCNLEVQNNIAGLIGFLAEKHGVGLVSIEGASKPVNVTHLSTYPRPTVKRAVGQYFMKQGLLSGAEYYAATGKQPVTLLGLEDGTTYQAARESGMAFLNDESQGSVFDLRETLSDVKPKVYSAELAAFDRV